QLIGKLEETLPAHDRGSTSGAVGPGGGRAAHGGECISRPWRTLLHRETRSVPFVLLPPPIPSHRLGGARSHQQTNDRRRHRVSCISGGSPGHLARPATGGPGHPAALPTARAPTHSFGVRLVVDDGH